MTNDEQRASQAGPFEVCSARAEVAKTLNLENHHDHRVTIIVEHMFEQHERTARAFAAKAAADEARIAELESLAKFNVETAHTLLKERDGALAGNRSLHEINSSLDSKFMLLQAEHSLALAKVAELESKKPKEFLVRFKEEKTDFGAKCIVVNGSDWILLVQLEDIVHSRTSERNAALDRIKNLRAALEFYTPLAIRFNNGELASNAASRALADDDAAQAKGNE